MTRILIPTDPRDIRSRARHADVPRCWVYGYFVVEHGSCYIINDDGKFKVVAGTACLYTGKQDRFKRDIYENDILAWNNGASKQEYRDSLWQVIWDNDQAAFTLALVAGLFTDTPHFVPHWPDYMEIIGDAVTTPPELLKEEQQ
jgi:hypothetical protein